MLDSRGKIAAYSTGVMSIVVVLVVAGCVGHDSQVADLQSKREFFIQVIKPDPEIDHVIMHVQPDPYVKYFLRFLDPEGKETEFRR